MPVRRVGAALGKLGALAPAGHGRDSPCHPAAVMALSSLPAWRFRGTGWDTSCRRED